MRGFAVVTALAVLLAGCTVTRSGEPGPTGSRGDEPTWEFTVDDTSVRVEPGDTFVVAVDDNASVGDQWSVSTEPDAAVVSADGDHFVSDTDEDVPGGGGTRYFEFTARESGNTTIELRNCFRGCHEPEDDKRYGIAVEVVG